MEWIQASLKTYKGLPKSIYVLFFASVINNMGNFVSLFLTLFLTQKVGMKLSLVGTIVAINAILGMVGALIGGRLIDTLGRKQILLIGRLTCALNYILCALTMNPVLLSLLLLLSSLIGGLSQPVYGTMITDLTEGEQRDTSFSLHYISINVGSSVGPLLAGFLFENFLVGFFLGDALTTLISLMMIWRHVPETKPSAESIQQIKKKDEQAEEGNLWQALCKRPMLLLFCGIIVIYFIVFSQFTFGLSLQTNDVFGLKGAKIFGLLIAINSILCASLTVFVNAFMQKLHAAVSIALGGVFYAVGFGMLFSVNSLELFILSTFIWTIGEIIVSTKTGVYIANHTPVTHRGRFNAVFPIIRRIGFATGPMIAGFFVEYTGLRYLWLLMGGLSVIGAVLMYWLYIKEKAVNEAEIEGIA